MIKAIPGMIGRNKPAIPRIMQRIPMGIFILFRFGIFGFFIFIL